MSSPVLLLPVLTKLRPSRRGTGVIDRPRLQAGQALAREVRLTTIVAPGGFGKSTLAASWMAAWQAEGLPCAWLTVEPEDDEPLQFLLYLTHALGRLHPEIGRPVLALLSTRMLTEPRALLNLLINDLARHVQEAVLLLDDYHCITDPTLHELMGYFLAHAPDGMHVVVVARSVPPLPVARLKAMGELLEITANELRFDAEEARRFVSGNAAEPPTAQQVEQLHAATGGWPAALRIATLAGQPPGPPGPDRPGAAPQFGDLLDDALSRLPASTLEFMAQTSIAERLNPDLCEALTGRADSAALLTGLLHSALLVEPLDGHGHWLRYHELLRDYLRGPLTQRLRLDLPPLHRRAARWYAGQEQWTEAVRHALAAGDTDQGVEWLARCGMEMVYQGDLLTLLGWRRRFPPELMRDRFELKLALAWGLVLALRFTDAAQLIDELAQDAARATDARMAASLRTHVTVLRAGAAAGRDDTLEAQALLDRCDLDLVDDWTAEAAASLRRFVLWKAGRREEAFGVSSGRTLGEDTPHAAFTAVFRTAIFAQMAFEAAQIRSAERHAESAERLVALHGSEQSTYHAVGMPLLAAVLYEKGDTRGAAVLMEPHLTLIDNVGWLDGALKAYLTLARAAHAAGSSEQAHSLLHRAEALGQTRGWWRLNSAALVQRLQWLAQRGQLADAVACRQRLARLARGQPASGCAWADLVFYDDWGGALLAWFEGRADDACEQLGRLLDTALASGSLLRAVALGLWKGRAEAALGRRDAADGTLADTLRLAQRGGVYRTVLDQGDDIAELLQRFLASPHCDALLSHYVRLLLSPEPAAAGPAAAPGAERLPAAGRRLTERECAVLALVALGLPNKEIARRLDISAETVKTHLSKAFNKLDVDNRGQAVRMARLYGLLP